MQAAHYCLPQNSLVHRLDETVAHFADCIAVVDDYQSLTFSQFAKRVLVLAAQLKLVIQPGDHVAVQLKRSADYIIAAYAIWKVGGVYLPLDDQWPESRIEGILHQAHVRAVIHHQEETAGMTVKITSFSTVPRIDLLVAGTPAYIIHTSGTTGTPKGVVITHQSLLHLVDSHQNNIYKPQKITSGPVAMNASFCFDSSLERLALVSLGYCVHVVSDQVRKSPPMLVNYLCDNRIVNVDLVPSHLKILLLAGLVDIAQALQLVIVGGEAIDAELWKNLAASRVTFFNVYGPTENTINTTFCKITADKPMPHIGQPFDGVECHIIGENNELCVEGEAGELIVSGQHLAQGYYNAPELTARAFIILRGKRCYRTGDLVKRDSQGNLFFLGRIDDQVKINGYRIELADVQYHLASLPAVRSAAVTPIKKTTGHSSLLASIVWEPEKRSGLTFADLIWQLSQKIPAYMVPDQWQQLEVLPLTDNLKLDHRAILQTWRDNQLDDHTASDQGSALSDAESLVQNIWQLILKKNVTNIDTHFFSSGGDSLAAMALLTELNKVTLLNVNLSDIFKHPTIRKMAAWLDIVKVKNEVQQ